MSRWYRAYEGTVTDAKLAEAAVVADVSRAVSIAAWHCLLESAAALNNCGSYEVTPRRVSIILCEAPAAVEALFAAYSEIGLIKDGVVLSWKKRQFDRHVDKGGESYVYVAGSDWGKAVKIGFSKNPWARATELQTGSAAKVEILAHFKCDANSEREIHELLANQRHAGEWFNLADETVSIFQKAAQEGASYDDLLRQLRSATSPIKAETETEVESPNGDSPSDDGLSANHVFEAYQDLAEDLGLPVPRDLTPERRQLIRGRIAHYPLADFLAAFAKCRGSPFLRGDRSGRTPLSIDWLMKKGNFQKVLEGNYDR
jgi:hypothetical protein